LGQVFVALDEELHREVALKEIQPRHVDHPESRSRFVLEAQITGGLEHPGIVPVYGLGQYADGRPFYAMRFIKGDSLKEVIARIHQADKPGRAAGERTLEFRKLLGRFVDVCNAIAYAHSRGVLRRDLKPGNIMLGQYGETLVVDWGLAKPVGRGEHAPEGGEPTLRPASASGSAETLAETALGTPAYMSPEQAAGRLDLLGPASDVYGLGATLYCLLTGKAPFAGADVGVILQRVQKGEFAPPRRVKPSAPAALEAVCLKAMALAPGDRYPSARALADEVEQWLADEPVRAWPEPWAVRARRWLGRHRTLVSATAAAALVAVVSLAVATVLLRAANEDLATANDGERKAKEYAQGKEWEAAQQRDEAKKQEQEAKKQELEATKQRDEANTQRDEARTQKNKAEAELLRAEWLVYAGKISLAQREWEANNAGVARALLDECRWDFRGWEHDYLYTLFNSNQRTLRGHTFADISVAFSPDGQRLVSASGDPKNLREPGEVKVWDARTGQETLALRGHTNWVTSVAFSPNGKRLVSGSMDNTVKVWDARTGQETLTLRGHTNRVHSVAFSPDGQRLASGSQDQTVKVWDASTGQHTLTLYGHPWLVLSVAFSPEGQRLVSAIWDQTVKLWYLPKPSQLMVVEGENLKVRAQSRNLRVLPQDMRSFNDGKWSGDKQLLALATERGAWTDLEVPVPGDGTYQIVAHLTRAPDYGILAFSLDGAPLDQKFDGYAPRVVSPAAVALATAALREGMAILRIQVVGSNRLAIPERYYWGLDRLELHRRK
jgi:tRNA A-37 threonylcarbamoyl transferase component Bud32